MLQIIKMKRLNVGGHVLPFIVSYYTFILIVDTKRRFDIHI